MKFLSIPDQPGADQLQATFTELFTVGSFILNTIYPEFDPGCVVIHLHVRSVAVYFYASGFAPIISAALPPGTTIVPFPFGFLYSYKTAEGFYFLYGW